MKTFTKIAAGILCAGSAFAASNGANVVYGVDNRLETFEAHMVNQARAASTAGMLMNKDALVVGKYTIMPPTTLTQRYGLCEDEKFKDQATPMMCSGFLVAPDLMVTAGHCIQTQADCENVSWVFDYKIDPKTGKSPVMVPNSNVYKCSKVLESKLERNAEGHFDYALVRLDRKVVGRKPLPYRTSGKVATGTDIVVIGHPSGLPQKVAGGAQVVSNSAANYFQTNLDTFGGNSGSAVFDDLTGYVEGILVRGAKDYERTPEGCIAVHETTQEVTDLSRYGESVSRITDVKTLKYRYKLLQAAQKGDLETVKELAEKVSEVNIYDNDMNTALHFAAANDQADVVKFLASKKANLNSQNDVGETALHQAAYNNAKGAMIALLDAGASALIKDKNGYLASDRTMYLAFGSRKILKKAEESQKK